MLHVLSLTSFSAPPIMKSYFVIVGLIRSFCGVSQFFCSPGFRVCSAWRGSAACWSGNIVRIEATTLAHRNRSSGRVPVRTYPGFELDRDQRASGLCPPGQLSRESSVSLFSRAVWHLDSDPLPCPLRFLHLVPRGNECG